MTINTAPAAFQAMLYGGAILGVLTALICLVAALWYTIQAKMSSDDKIKSGANSHLKNVAVTIGWIGFGIFMLTDLLNQSGGQRSRPHHDDYQRSYRLD